MLVGGQMASRNFVVCAVASFLTCFFDLTRLIVADVFPSSAHTYQRIKVRVRVRIMLQKHGEWQKRPHGIMTFYYVILRVFYVAFFMTSCYRKSLRLALGSTDGWICFSGALHYATTPKN